MAIKGQKFQKYSQELKNEAIRLVREENKSVRETAKQLNIRNKSQVHRWTENYRQGKRICPTPVKRERPKTTFTNAEEEVTYLRAEIEYLKKQYPNLHKE